MPIVEFLKETAQELIAEAGVKGAAALITGVASNAAPKVAEKVAETYENYMRVKNGDTEDERRYTIARNMMDPNDRLRLGERLRDLVDQDDPRVTFERMNYFRMTLPLHDLELTKDALTGYAQIDDDQQWADEIAQMDLKREAIGNKFIAAVKAKRQQHSDTLHDHPIRTRIQEWRDRARQRAEDQPW